MPEKATSKILPGDYFIAAIILVLSLSSFFAFSAGSSGTRALVYREGRLVRQIDLARDQLIPDAAGFEGLDLEISRGRARIARVNCPRETCRHMGWVSGAGRTLVCIPNKVVIELAGEKEESGCDAIIN